MHTDFTYLSVILRIALVSGHATVTGMLLLVVAAIHLFRSVPAARARGLCAECCAREEKDHEERRHHYGGLHSVRVAVSVASCSNFVSELLRRRVCNRLSLSFSLSRNLSVSNE